MVASDARADLFFAEKPGSFSLGRPLPRLFTFSEGITAIELVVVKLFDFAVGTGDTFKTT